MADAVEDLTLDQLESEIAELAAHINAATCRWLLLIGELDRREAWAEWGYKSCAHWLSARCGLGLHAARQHVRVATALSNLHAIAASFGRGELSYSQVRALTRVATPEIEAELLYTARHATGAQLEVLVRAYRGVLARELETVNHAYLDRFVIYCHEDDGSLVLSARLPAEDGARVLAALEAARDELRAGSQAKGETGRDGSAEPSLPAGATRADALVLMADTLLASGPKPAPGGERHELVVHVDAATLADDEDGACALEGGPSLHPETARRLGCDSSLVRILERDGRPLSVGRKTRTVPPALARALRSRDGGCRFPGCTERRFVDAHHIEHWARGGRTDMSNLVQLCRRHHRLIHEGGFRIRRGANGTLAFHRPDGRLVPKVPRLRRGDRRELAARNRRRGLEVDDQTAVPQWQGDRLELVYAVDGRVAADPRLAEPPLSAGVTST